MFKNKVVWIIIAIVAILFFWVKGVYNNMVTQDEGVKTAWSQVENQYQRRMDLIPNLVNTVKGYAAHEKNTLESVILARTKGMEAVTIDSKLDAARLLSDAMVKLKAVVENYPELKADVNFMHLQEKLSEIEERLVNTRSFFNMATREYNDQVMSFPQNLIARISGFGPESMLDIFFVGRDALLATPNVNF